MTSIRAFTCDDFFRLQHVNLDVFTENFGLSFYLQYLSTWPDMCYVAESLEKRVMGYMFGKAEGNGQEWHGHVTAVSVGPQFRRSRLANALMQELEIRSDYIFDGYFVDLFVRVSNAAAVDMYKRMGYCIYRTVLQYYDGSEDAYDMRRALSRDKLGAPPNHVDITWGQAKSIVYSGKNPDDEIALLAIYSSCN